MEKITVLIIQNSLTDVEIYIEGGWMAIIYEHNKLILRLYTEQVVPTHNEWDLGCFNRGYYEYRRFKKFIPTSEIIKEALRYFNINPENCDFIHMKYRENYTHHFMMLVMFYKDIFFVLDLYSGAGGASAGMHFVLEKQDIEHIVIGFDNRFMPDYSNEYPFCFINEDVLGIQPILLKFFRFIWGSPPCQKFVSVNLKRKTNHPNLISKTRKLLSYSKKPYVLENVRNAPIRRDLVLCGTMFNLGVFRHRYFEISGFACQQPKHFKHRGRLGDGKYFCVISGGQFRDKKSKENREKNNYFYGEYKDWCMAMGINWIRFEWKDYKSRVSNEHLEFGPILPSGHPLIEAVPPAYAKYIMGEFLNKNATLDKWINSE